VKVEKRLIEACI